MAKTEQSQVWGLKLQDCQGNGGLLQGLNELMDQSGLRELCSTKGHVAVKVDAGRIGNVRYLRPVIIRKIAEKISEYGGTPILVDTVEMTGGALNDSADWFYTTSIHGFSKDILPADGYTGREGDLLPIDGVELGGLEVARGVAQASAVVVVSHITGQPMFGLNGALFHQGAGCAAQKGKWRIFSPLKPVTEQGKCDQCLACVSACPLKAIVVEQGPVHVKYELCKGCNYNCIPVCPHNALQVPEGAVPKFQTRVVEAATAVNVATQGKLFYLNFLLDIGQYPDNYTLCDQNVVPDLAILASRDPVAIDQASLDLITNSPGYVYVEGEQRILAPGTPKFNQIFGVNETFPLQYAEEYGLGSRKYHLEMIGGPKDE